MKNWFFLLLIITTLSCNSNNVTQDDSLKQFFDANKVTGTFAIYDNGQGQFTIYNLSRYKDSAYLPASTFKIVNSLIGLETGRIVDEKMKIKPVTLQASRPECDREMTMKEAFTLSCIPYYQEVARMIGKDTMQHYLDSLGYGARYKKAVINKIDSFWIDNSIKITADEQLGLVKKLYFDQLPFQKRTQRIVKEVMLVEKNANYSLSYKTGWGYKENGKSIGWIVGWIEENRHPYPFVLNIEGEHDMDMRTVRLNVLNSIFKHLGFKEGKK
ncbi:MAG TPA: penicillin-binding transpeptidase domain-containing protein [Segetibacter sp.]|jgi:beta-lactamase class D